MPSTFLILWRYARIRLRIPQIISYNHKGKRSKLHLSQNHREYGNQGHSLNLLNLNKSTEIMRKIIKQWLAVSAIASIGLSALNRPGFCGGCLV